MKTAPYLATFVAALLFSALSPCFAQSSGAISFGKPKSAESAELVTVQAKGQGESVEAAKKDAVRNAIKTAVGELVDARTLVENDELVEDRILTLSNAMVDKADYGDARNIGDGLFEVPVTAVVKKGRLNQELKAAGIATGAVKGDSLAAELFTGKERVANAEKFFAERFKDFPKNVMEAVMLTKDDGSPDVEVDSGTGHVFANVGLRVNMENYSEWAGQLQEVLGAVCTEKEEATFSFRDIESGSHKGQRTASVSLRAKGPFIVSTPKKPERSSWPASVYYLDEQMWKVLARTLNAGFPKSGSVEVSLKDGDEEIVCSSKIDLPFRVDPNSIGALNSGSALRFIPIAGPCSEQWPQNNCLFIAPIAGVCIDHSGDIYCFKETTSKFRLDLGEISEDDLGAVTGYEVKVEYTKPRP